MSVLEIRLFGGFEVRWGKNPVTWFESQKVRALLAYLVLNSGGAPNRDHLASLLWPDEGTARARKNLRQALYNLRTTLARADASLENPLIATHQSVQLNPELPWWSDVAAFEETARRGWAPAGREDIEQLTRAAHLYRGDLLPSFFVKDSVAFEDWLLAQQERYRELAIQVLRRLVDYYERGGDLRLAITHARRLVEVDALSEETHRELMRLYALSGRRSAALNAYENLRDLLREELDVAPLQETTALYEAVAADSVPPVASPARRDEGLVLPLVGRAAAQQELRRSWQMARRGRCRVALIEGGAGIGKTRLARQLLHEVDAESHATVLQARCSRLGWCRPLHGFVDLLRETLHLETPEARSRMERLHPAWQAQLRTLLPELADVFPGAPPSEPSRELMFAAVTELLGAILPVLSGARREAPVVVFLDNLEHADPATFELLPYLADTFADAGLWIVLASRPDVPAFAEARDALRRRGVLDEVSIGELEAADLHDLARQLVPPAHVAALLEAVSGPDVTVPAVLAERINVLCDAGTQVRGTDHPWRLTGTPPPVLEDPSPAGVVDWRIQQLPSSAARLLSMAAVIGRRFEASLLQDCEHEHRVVVDTGLASLVEARFIERVTVLFEPDAVRQPTSAAQADGVYEFCHGFVRDTLYAAIGPTRRQLLHSRVGVALESRPASAEAPALVAEHLLLGGQSQRAVPWLERAAERCRALGAEESARLCRQRMDLAARSVPQGERRHGDRRRSDRRQDGGSAPDSSDRPGGSRTPELDKLLRRSKATPPHGERRPRETFDPSRLTPAGLLPRFNQ